MLDNLDKISKIAVSTISSRKTISVAVGNNATITRSDIAGLRTAYVKLRRTTLDASWSLVGTRIGIYNAQWALRARSVVDSAVRAASEALWRCAQLPPVADQDAHCISAEAAPSSCYMDETPMSLEVLTSLDQFATMWKNLSKGKLKELLADMQFSSGSVALSQFSQWLAEFDPSQCRIEIPGQYLPVQSSGRMPRPERHEMIIGKSKRS
jgi:hypothetical protein